MPYQKWYERFLIMFALMAAAVVFSAWLGADIPQRDAALITVLVVALAVWFYTFGQFEKITSDLHAIAYLLGNVIVVSILIRIWDGSSLLLFPTFWFGFAYLLTGPAIIYAGVITMGMQWGFGSLDSGISWSKNTFAGIGVVAVMLIFSGFMARYIEAFHHEASRNKQLYAQLRAAQASLAVKEREAGMELERQRLAGEIHDTIAQQFTSVITNLQAANQVKEFDSASFHRHTALALEAATQGLKDSRSLLSAMQPDVLQGRSLSETLTEIVESFDREYPCSATFHQEGAPVQLSRSTEAILVRTLQESLRNIAKHAQAHSVTTTLSWLDDEVLLDISDDGQGFDPHQVMTGSDGHHLGLATMQTRIEHAGGTFALESTIGEGTSLAASFPTGVSK